MAWDFLVSLFLLSVTIPAKEREISTSIRAVRESFLSVGNLTFDYLFQIFHAFSA